ncbi:hypothetical protein A5886_001463 [Enterococcus sp. 8G7_MSG3316]|uniref:Uncharacterized protein n=1 Tax=Candidatus Enterococcus testudinis TaxID=1834191 RepID=A0A242A5S4_9ENTE|nr:hypothetical protein [Enterococcus sp. 8G7_MSG3316]OTN76386.1 hypothetical protein A5886_001463 [Enterococcus sp. 8G7_MSG3316]
MRSIFLLELKEMKHSMIVFILSMLALIATCLTITWSVDTYIDLKENETQFIDVFGEGETDMYRVTYQGDFDVLERLFYTDALAMERKAVFEALRDHPDFTYTYTQNVGIFFFLENQMPHYNEAMIETVNESGVQLWGMHGDPLFFEQSSVNIDEGDVFSRGDYVIDEPDPLELPVVLGSGYKAYYQIGSQIDAAYTLELDHVTLVVKGFLEEGSSVTSHQGHKILLDHFMIVPAIETNYDPFLADGFDEVFLRTYRTDKLLDGRLAFPADKREHVLTAVREIFHQYQMYELALWSETEQAVSILSGLKQETLEFTQLSILIVFVTLSMSVIQVYYKVLRNRKKYSTFVLTGMKKFSLLSLMNLESILLIVATNVIYGICVIRLQERGETFGFTLLTVCIVLLFQFCLLIMQILIGYTRIYQVDMSSTLRQRE